MSKRKDCESKDSEQFICSSRCPHAIYRVTDRVSFVKTVRTDQD